MANFRKQIKSVLLRLGPKTEPLVRYLGQRRYALKLRKAYRRLAAPKPEQRPHGLPGKLVVSLTSYPPRYQTLPLTIRSLLRQTNRPDEIVLWLSEDDAKQLTKPILELRDQGLTIRECARDLKSGNKLIHALTEYPDSFVVTCDDDIYYPENWLETLVVEVNPSRKEIIGMRAHLASFDAEGRALPYNSWNHEISLTTKPRQRAEIFLTGIGGVLYPPASLDPRASDADAYLRLCARADDIWFFAMAELAGTPRRRTRRQFDLISWPDSQECGLMVRNVGLSENDRQMVAVEDAFPELLKLRLRQ